MGNSLARVEPNSSWMSWIEFKKIVKTEPNQNDQIWLGWILNLANLDSNWPVNNLIQELLIGVGVSKSVKKLWQPNRIKMIKFDWVGS